MTDVAIMGGYGHVGLPLELALAHSGKRVVAVTHSMTFGEKVYPKAFWLEAGEMRKIGDSKEVRTLPPTAPSSIGAQGRSRKCSSLS